MLDFADQTTRARCLRVNSAFYAAGVKQTYHTVKLFTRPDTTLPLSGARGSVLASYVRVVDVLPHSDVECRLHVRELQGLPNLRTVRIRTNVYGHSNYNQRCVVPTHLRPHTLVLRDSPITRRHVIGFGPTILQNDLPATSNVICVLDPARHVSDSSLSNFTYKVLLPSTPMSLTTVFWTPKRDEAWNPMDTDIYDLDGAWRTALWLFVRVLIEHPVPDRQPLLTIVNAGALSNPRDPMQSTFTHEQRAAEFESSLKNTFNDQCNKIEDGSATFMPDSGGAWDPRTRDRLHNHLRFLTMDEFLAEHKGDAFDAHEMAGWC